LKIKNKILAVIGARPQFIKHAALEIALRKSFEVITIHTGQHYDENMSAIFFEQLGMQKPHYMLQVNGGNHGDQTGKMMIALEEIVTQERPDWVLVYGDTNSTLAGALVAAKLKIKIIHVEAGLRSFNKDMPEEINRIVTDHLSSMHLCPTDSAVANLKKEGIVENVFNVGDVMNDMIRIAIERGVVVKNSMYESYHFVTIHRPYNTDSIERLINIISALNGLDKKVIFSVHPRTLEKLKSNGLNLNKFLNIEFIEPVSYFESLQYQFSAASVITDSGGMQKEAYILGKKCITIRTETEWTETVTAGWNTLVFNDLNSINEVILKELPTMKPLLFGDGQSANKIVKIIKDQTTKSESDGI
jgi:UDP-GlcNAc3NAcA epimerase